MRQHPRLFEVLKRSDTGPIIDEIDFERRMVAPTIKKLVEKYQVEYSGDIFVNFDDDLADRVFQAGLEFASEVGVYHHDTRRRITWTATEIEEGLKNCNSVGYVGDGMQKCKMTARVPEDSKRVGIFGGVVGIPFPEDLYKPLTLSLLKTNMFDIIDSASLDTAYGHQIKAGTAWEVLGARRESELVLECLEEVGKIGTPFGAVQLSPTALGNLAGVTWGGLRPFDHFYVPMTSEFKISHDFLSTVAHFQNLGGFISPYYNPIYGGYAGGAEGIAVAVAAGIILLNQITMGHTFCTRPTHPFYGCDTTQEILWATSLGAQAITRNTNLMMATLAGPASGPGTKTILYENAAFSLMAITSGVSELLSSHSAGGSVPRHGSPLDSMICAEVARSIPGMTRKQANTIVAKLVKLYEPVLPNKPIGKPFEEIYNLDKLEPIPEWQGMYDEVKEELIGYGLPLNYDG
jgi:methylamine--corrinoid protein Co-methyltransferase